MSWVYGSIMDTIQEIVGGFDSKQMIAIGVVLLVAVALGFFIGAIATYASGIRKGKLAGAKDAIAIAKEKVAAKETDHKQALLAEQQKGEELRKQQDAELSAKQAKLEEAEQAKLAAEQAALAAKRSKEVAERIALEAEKSREETVKSLEEAEKAKQEAEKSRLEAEKAAREAEEQMRALRESDAIVKERKKKIDLLSKEEILSYAEGLAEYAPTAIYARGGENLPDSCRVGICTYMLVYERKNMVKLVLRLHRKTAAALEQQFKLFTPAVYPKGGDWYRWILSPEVTDLGIVTAAINMAYKYVYLSNYGERGDSLNVNYVNKEENLINAAILKYQNLPDRDFIVASDAAEGANAAYDLYGKEEMTAYCRTLGANYPVSVSEGGGDLAPNTFKVGGKTFMMAYEKDGVAKMIFRVSEEQFAELKRLHPTADVSPFPKAKGYSWYVAYVDETFTSDAEIEEIIRSACAHVYALARK